jgi:hypothetical protein
MRFDNRAVTQDKRSEKHEHSITQMRLLLVPMLNSFLPPGNDEVRKWATKAFHEYVDAFILVGLF